MTDLIHRLTVFLSQAVAEMEMGTDFALRRTQPVFSTGKSSLSFGAFQHDVANNPTARQCFDAILGRAVTDGLITPADQTRLTALALSDQATRRAAPPATADFALMARLLAREDAAIQALDQAQAERLAAQLAQAITALANHPGGAGALAAETLDPVVITLLGSWANRTGGIGRTVTRLNALPGAITRAQVETQLSTYRQFRPRTEGGNGEDFPTYRRRAVAAATRAAALLA